MVTTTKIYKVELMVVDTADRPFEYIKNGLENCKYIHPTVISAELAEIESWDDDHPLNKKETVKEAFQNLFEYQLDDGHSTYVKAIDQEVDFD